MNAKHFKIVELVPPNVHNARGEKAWELIDPRLIEILDRLRSRYGKMTVNNWFWGGEREWSGLRTPDSPYYSPYSQHSFGRAADCLFADVSVEEVRADILGGGFSFVGGIEEDVSWLHIDVRNYNGIKRFRA